MKINRNYIWSQVAVKQLAVAGVKYACISPGSRNTPLTLAFDNCEEIKTYVLPDERSSSFFALGLAKKSQTPIAIVTTSGTAVAELYPAIIEAYLQHIPLIVCTADRPDYLRNTGANQTINQENIFANHIISYTDVGLPKINFKSIKKLLKNIESTLTMACRSARGPVHINFPFEKPLEPENYTDSIEPSLYDKIFSTENFKENFKPKINANIPKSLINELASKFKKLEKGLIICGGGVTGKSFYDQCLLLSEKLGYPVFADGTSNIRFSCIKHDGIFTNYTSFLSARKFQQKFDAEVIIQFGDVPTSNRLLEYFKFSKAEKYIINEFGDFKDPSKTADVIFKAIPQQFCTELNAKLPNYNKYNSEWFSALKKLENAVSDIKKNFITDTEFPFESKVISELFNSLPKDCNVMISNSTPIRDIDNFVSSSKYRLNLFVNRGASGIDGIISTALGIAEASGKFSLLLTGDLAFYHDMNGLLAAMKYSIPLNIVLINNNGGGIFYSLPVANSSESFENNFITPHNLDFAHFILGYNGHYFGIRHLEHFKEQFPKTFTRKRFAVIEVKTDSKKSAELRKEYFKKCNDVVSTRIKNEA